MRAGHASAGGGGGGAPALAVVMLAAIGISIVGASGRGNQALRRRERSAACAFLHPRFSSRAMAPSRAITAQITSKTLRLTERIPRRARSEERVVSTDSADPDAPCSPNVSTKKRLARVDVECLVDVSARAARVRRRRRRGSAARRSRSSNAGSPATPPSVAPRPPLQPLRRRSSPPRRHRSQRPREDCDATPSKRAATV